MENHFPGSRAPHRMVCAYAEPALELDLAGMVPPPVRRRCQYGGCTTWLAQANPDSCCYLHAAQLERDKLEAQRRSGRVKCASEECERICRDGHSYCYQHTGVRARVAE